MTEKERAVRAIAFAFGLTLERAELVYKDALALGYQVVAT